MTEAELIKKMAEATESTRAKAGRAVKAMADVIVDAIAAGEVVRVPGLGSFAPTMRRPRRGRNPQTGASINIPARTALRFRAGKAVTDTLNRSIPAAPSREAPIRSLAHPVKVIGHSGSRCGGKAAARRRRPGGHCRPGR